MLRRKGKEGEGGRHGTSFESKLEGIDVPNLKAIISPDGKAGIVLIESNVEQLVLLLSRHRQRHLLLSIYLRIFLLLLQLRYFYPAWLLRSDSRW